MSNSEDFILGIKQNLPIKKRKEVFQELDKVKKNAIIADFLECEQDDIPIGSSKSGGFPDLPPEIEYPTMSEITDDCSNPPKTYPESAMQLVAQINLSDVKHLDTDNLLPETGMLYFFWSGELWCNDNKNDNYKVIYYNGDLTKLRRTKPAVPYYSKYFEKPFESGKLIFSNDYEYNIKGNEKLEQMEEIQETLEIAGCDEFYYSDSKLLGYANGVNIPKYCYNDEYINLFQYDYKEGCLWGIYFFISKTDLKNLNFDNVEFDCDMD